MLKDYEFDGDDYKPDELQNDGVVILKGILLQEDTAEKRTVGCAGWSRLSSTAAGYLGSHTLVLAFFPLTISSFSC